MLDNVALCYALNLICARSMHSKTRSGVSGISLTRAPTAPKRQQPRSR